MPRNTRVKSYRRVVKTGNEAVFYGVQIFAPLKNIPLPVSMLTSMWVETSPHQSRVPSESVNTPVAEHWKHGSNKLLSCVINQD